MTKQERKALHEGDGLVYIIHFEKKLKHAGHYIGFCEAGNLEKRMATHRAGNGSKLMAAVTEAGINWEVAHVFEGKSRHFERYLKNQKNSKRFCPFCRDSARG